MQGFNQSQGYYNKDSFIYIDADCNLMNQGVQDNRDFYRIQDNVLLEFQLLPEGDIAHWEVFPIPVTAEFHLLNELSQIDAENSQVLRNIAERDRNTATYLNALNHKIELLARIIAGSNEELEQLVSQQVTLSEGGISFNSDMSMKIGAKVALKVLLLPSYVGLLLYGKVVNCNEHIKGDYLVNLVFEDLTENNRHLLARHVLQHQAKMRRENLEQESL